MIESLDAIRPTALPALLFLIWVPVFLLVPARLTLAFFLVTGVLTLIVLAGPALALGLMAAIVIGYLLVESIAWLQHGRRAGFIAGFVLLSLGYWSCFFLPLPAAYRSPDLRICDQAAVFVLFSGVGFSFFRLISYFRDRVHGGAAKLSLRDYLAYMLYFPQFRHGPIERAHAFVSKLQAARQSWSGKGLLLGLARIGLGIVGLAALNRLQAAWLGTLPEPLQDSSFAQLSTPQTLPAAQLLLLIHMPGVLLYILESSYASVALGVSRVFGVVGTENFNFPFLARDPREVWHRWNITLSQWLRDYAYIPLGGNRRRKYVNMAVVFAYCGLLHGLEPRCFLWGVWAGCTLALYAWIRDALAPWLKKVTLLQRHAALRIAAAVLCRVLTFHWFCIGVTIIIDPDRYGMAVLGEYLRMLIGQRGT